MSICIPWKISLKSRQWNGLKSFKNLFSQYKREWIMNSYHFGTGIHSLLFRRNINSTRRKPASSFLRNQEARSRVYNKTAKKTRPLPCASSRLLFKWLLRMLLSPKLPGGHKVYTSVNVLQRPNFTCGMYTQNCIIQGLYRASANRKSRLYSVAFVDISIRRHLCSGDKSSDEKMEGY